MKIFRSRSAIALTAAAVLSMTASPAMARGWKGHHRDRVDAGDIFAGILVIGGIAAIASAASKSSREKRAREQGYPDARYPDRRYPDTRYPNSRYPDSRYPDARNYPDNRGAPGGYGRPGEDRPTGENRWGSAGSTDAAIDRCAAEVERSDRQVDTVDTVNRDGNGWRVEGQVRDGGNYSCTVDSDGSIRRVTVNGQAII